MRIRLIIFIPLIFISLSVFADGSKDLYPAGVKGNRAYLFSGWRTFDDYQEITDAGETFGLVLSWCDLGEHFVYAKAGEQIALASSAQNVDAGFIRITSPNNIVYNMIRNGDIGRIKNRAAELAGPEIGYIPHVHQVGPNEEGIWRVEFIPTSGLPIDKGAVITRTPNVAADGHWEQEGMNNQIAAWDISVKGIDDQWKPGRVYAQTLRLELSREGFLKKDGSAGLYAQHYILTRDGYIYRFQYNGALGPRFSVHINRKGILRPTDYTSIYRSSDEGTSATIYENILSTMKEEPTHRIFYHVPDMSMPLTTHVSSGYLRQDPWLLPINQTPVVRNLSLSRLEDGINYINYWENKITFYSDIDYRYRIWILPASADHSFTPKYIDIQAHAGNNDVIWNGLDGSGSRLSLDTVYPIRIAITSLESEAHFLFYNLSTNPQGFRLDRMNKQGNFEPAALYWDDSFISPGLPTELPSPIINLSGILSPDNGHHWGSYTARGLFDENNNGTGEYSFGTSKLLDTWSYFVQEHLEKTFTVTQQIADLEVREIYTDKDTIEVNEPITYTIVICNNGPNDVTNSNFYLTLPTGFEITHLDHENHCGSIKIPPFSSNRLHIVVSLPNQCQLVLKVKARAVSPDDESYGIVHATAGIVRPPKYIDPDATRDGYILNPGLPQEECSPYCNNIKTEYSVILLESEEERGSITLLKTVGSLKHPASNFDEVGDTLLYSFTIKNTGLVPLTNVQLSDPKIGDGYFLLPKTVLTPQEEIMVMAPYILSTEDLSQPFVINSATVSGINPRYLLVSDVSGTAMNNDEPTSFNVNPRPTVRLKKTVTNTGTGESNQFTLGDNINYKFEIQHTGIIPVEQIYLSDPMLFEGSILLPIDQLFNETKTYEADYKVTYHDNTLGYVSNSAHINTADDVFGEQIEAFSGSSFTTVGPTVTSVARPPQAIDDTLRVFPEATSLLDILENDHRGSSSLPLNSIRIKTLPSQGSIEVIDGKIAYSTNEQIIDEDYFTYSIVDASRLESNIARVTISSIYATPVAVADNYFTGINYRISLKLYENDYVVGGEIDTNSIEIFATPSKGQLMNLGNGLWEYRPDQNFTGFDYFEYIIRDKYGNKSAPATVTIETKGFIISNVVTPNGDGMNDNFTILGTYLFDTIELEILNRFGKTIFSAKDYQNDWVINPLIKSGTYYYIFRGKKAGHKTIEKKGALLIMR